MGLALYGYGDRLGSFMTTDERILRPVKLKRLGNIGMRLCLHIAIVIGSLVVASCSTTRKGYIRSDHVLSNKCHEIDTSILIVDTLLGGPDETRLWFGIFFPDELTGDVFLTIAVGYDVKMNEALAYYRNINYTSEMVKRGDRERVFGDDYRSFIKRMANAEGTPAQYRKLCVALDEWISSSDVDEGVLLNALLDARSYYYDSCFGTLGLALENGVSSTKHESEPDAVDGAGGEKTRD